MRLTKLAESPPCGLFRLSLAVQYSVTVKELSNHETRCEWERGTSKAWVCTLASKLIGYTMESITQFGLLKVMPILENGPDESGATVS
jgi:hypothetical protein